MSLNIDDYFKKLLAELEQVSHVNPNDLPNIDLYMDQVTTFMDSKLDSTKRHADDKILTKTMINNYAKNDVLPPPVKKKYSKEHMLMLIFIYYFKSMISIGDTQTLMKPICDKYFNNTDGINLEDIYRVIYKNCKEDIIQVTEEIEKQFKHSKDTFTDAPEEDRDYLQLYSFVCSMAFDVYIKRLIIEKIIDGYFQDSEKSGKKKDIKKESKKK